VLRTSLPVSLGPSVALPTAPAGCSSLAHHDWLLHLKLRLAGPLAAEEPHQLLETRLS
jgi:hypothetical protein